MRKAKFLTIAVTFFLVLAMSVFAETCYNSVRDIPATCEGGSITSDTYNGGRSITCGDLKVAAWDKGGYFEMYKQAGGSAVKICLGSTCIKENGFAKSPNYPICTGTTPTTNQTNASDPGAQSTLSLSSGTINGQSVSSSSRIVTVAPGAAITGTVNLQYTDAWPAEISTPLGVTRTWGEASSGFTELGDTSGSAKTVGLSYTAPSAPGDYNLIFAYRAETTTAHVFSLTNWAHGAPVWNDGNDIAQWSSSMISTANSQGRVQANVLFDEGMRQQYIPATAITIRVSSSTTPPNQTNQACYTKVNQLPVSCTGGTVTTDTGTGCRTIVCSNGNDRIKALACDKPTTSSPTYFEVYKQEQIGSSVSKVCYGNTCVGSSSGFAKGTYPVCVGTAPNTTNNTNTTTPPPNTTNTTGGATVRYVQTLPTFWGGSVKVSNDHNAVFECVVPGFRPTEFRWNFGDGRTAIKNAGTVDSMDNWNYYYHSYLNNGTYTVTCTAVNGSQTATGSTTITIGTEATAAEIQATLPADETDPFSPFVFRPVARRVSGSTYDVGGYAVGLPRGPNGEGQYGHWSYGLNGQGDQGYFYNQYTSNHDSILRIIFPEPGTYTTGAVAGLSETPLSPEYYTSGMEKRGCSNPRSSCQSAWGTVNVVVPDRGTRTQYGIIARQTGSRTYNISCQSYATDDGASGSLAFGDGQYVQFSGNQWFTHTFPSEGPFNLWCNHRVNEGIDYRYESVLNVTGGNTTPPTTNTTAACFSSVKNLNASCQNSNLVSSREVSGCMEYVCSSNTGSITVKACDKPSTSYHPYYFEMYKTAKSGYGPNFCLGETCFQNSDFARSKTYPACLLAPDDRGWTEYLSGWSYENGIYHATNTNADVPVESYYAEGKQNGWTNYEAQVDMKLGSSYTPSDSQLIYRYQNSSIFGACRIMQWQGTYLQITDAQHDIVNQVSFPFNVGEWYTLKATVQGNQVSCEVVGYPETKITGAYDLSTSGTVGLRGTHIPVDYRNMVVTFK